jgi:hypothetical protein
VSGQALAILMVANAGVAFSQFIVLQSPGRTIKPVNDWPPARSLRQRRRLKPYVKARILDADEPSVFLLPSK